MLLLSPNRSPSNTSVTDEGVTNQETLLDALGVEIDALNVQDTIEVTGPCFDLDLL